MCRHRTQRLTTKAALDWQTTGHMLEYVKYSNPGMSAIPVDTFAGQLHKEGPTRIIPFDESEHYGMEALQVVRNKRPPCSPGAHLRLGLKSLNRLCPGVDYPATSPNLLASFLRILPSEDLETQANASSQAFYVIRGSGHSRTHFGDVKWQKGDLFVVPGTSQNNTHSADAASREDGGAALYWVTDEPLLQYLGVTPSKPKFEPTVFRAQDMVNAVKELQKDPHAAESNRIGVLLASEATHDTTFTLTHTLWALFDVLPANSVQPPHKHSAVALDLAVSCPSKGVYTAMARELDAEGNLVDPVKVKWAPGGAFITPPGWWHSHHNETDEDTWVLPIQDAALYTYQRTLDIRFAKSEIHQTTQPWRIRGATFAGSNIISTG